MNRATPKPRKVAHLTSVHPPRDPRIYLKECGSLAQAGYEVVLIVPVEEAEAASSIPGVTIRPVQRRAGRISRMLRTTRAVYRAARAERADIYHFHDPELIPWAALLRLHGSPVVYDVHEDYHSGILQKQYLPRSVRTLVARTMDLLEKFAARIFHVVIAEEYYRDRFPNGHEVLNYPVVTEAILNGPGCDPTSGRLLYTGSVTADRGAEIHAGILGRTDDVSVTLIGKCSPALAGSLRMIAGPAAGRLTIVGEGTYVDPAVIQTAYREGGWLAGLAIFPDTLHYRQKILTKMFEYMMAGLPIICSDFPVWRKVVDDIGCGICVRPDRPEEIAEAIASLRADPGEARAMGERGRAAVLSRYRWETQEQNLLALYDGILSPGAPSKRTGAHSDLTAT